MNKLVSPTGQPLGEIRFSNDALLDLAQLALQGVTPTLELWPIVDGTTKFIVGFTVTARAIPGQPIAE